MRALAIALALSFGIPGVALASGSASKKAKTNPTAEHHAPAHHGAPAKNGKTKRSLGNKVKAHAGYAHGYITGKKGKGSGVYDTARTIGAKRRLGRKAPPTVTHGGTAAPAAGAAGGPAAGETPAAPPAPAPAAGAAGAASPAGAAQGE